MRALALGIPPFQAQFLRYAFGFVVLLPLIVLHGPRRYWPQRVGGQFTRGALHTIGLALWFTALPRIPLADMTAIGFTGPIFILIGAWLYFKEPMRWERWLATGLGFVGVLIVVGPKIDWSGTAGLYHLIMLASAPMFAASFLVTKALTRSESTLTILVWQSITVSAFSLVPALWVWEPPSTWQWVGFLACGLLGTAGHYCITQSFRSTDISATQSVKFLDLIWAALLGWAVFGDSPSLATLAGGTLIAAATLWLARRESR